MRYTIIICLMLCLGIMHAQEYQPAIYKAYLHEKMDAYVINLRKNEFPVVVYEDNLDRLFKAEAEWIAALEKKAKTSPEATEMHTQEFTKFMKP